MDIPNFQNTDALLVA